jgi:hypothetical protein
VTDPDAAWSTSAATWKTRDGRTGWTGGKADAAARRPALEAFLKTNPPAPVAARAQTELANLNR